MKQKLIHFKILFYSQNFQTKTSLFLPLTICEGGGCNSLLLFVLLFLKIFISVGFCLKIAAVGCAGITCTRDRPIGRTKNKLN